MGLPLCEILWLSMKNCRRSSILREKNRDFSKFDYLLTVTLTFDPRGQRSYFFLVVLIVADPTMYNLFASVVPFRRQNFLKIFRWGRDSLSSQGYHTEIIGIFKKAGIYVKQNRSRFILAKTASLYGEQKKIEKNLGPRGAKKSVFWPLLGNKSVPSNQLVSYTAQA